jgi:hypothetical protein
MARHTLVFNLSGCGRLSAVYLRQSTVIMILCIIVTICTTATVTYGIYAPRSLTIRHERDETIYRSNAIQEATMPAPRLSHITETQSQSETLSDSGSSEFLQEDLTLSLLESQSSLSMSMLTVLLDYNIFRFNLLLVLIASDLIRYPYTYPWHCNSFIHPLIHSSTHPLIHSFTHSLPTDVMQKLNRPAWVST